ncbi:MAG: alpha/beta fold hydrolase [Pseudomonadota bacterium]
MKETVALIHGLGRTPVSFVPMKQRFQRAGYGVMEPVYYPFRTNRATLARRLVGLLPRRGRVHLVGHSLGGILSLTVMEMLPVEQRGRIVQLGSPNLGAPAAAKAEAMEALFGDLILELARKGPPPPAGVELAAIAGNRSISAFSWMNGLTEPNDGLVAVSSALAMAQPANRMVLPVFHALMMRDEAVIEASLQFVQTGRLNSQPLLAAPA